MAEFLDSSPDKFGRTREYFSTDESKVRVSTHERPKDVDSAPTVIVPGWTGNPDVYAPVHHAIFAEGRNTVSFQYTDEVPDLNLTQEEQERANGFPSELRAKASSLLASIQYSQAIDQSLNKKADIIAHSEGFAVAVAAAAIRPGLFRDIVGVGPLGVAENESWYRLLTGFIGQRWEKPYWGNSPTDVQTLASEYVEENRESLRETWRAGEGRSDPSEQSFERFLAARAATLAEDFETKRRISKEHGIEEFVVTPEDHAEAAQRRSVSDMAFLKFIASRPRQALREALEMPGINVAKTLQWLSDVHNIGFTVVLGAHDSVTHTGRKDLGILKDIFSIRKAKPTIRERQDAQGKRKLVAVFDRVVRTFILPGGHQALVGYDVIAREVERALTRLNRERI